MPREQFVNEMTGEVMSPAEYGRAARELERDIFKLDRTIDDLKSSLKAAKEDHLKAVSALRAIVRESRHQTSRARVVKLRKSQAREDAPGRG